MLPNPPFGMNPFLRSLQSRYIRSRSLQSVHNQILEAWADSLDRLGYIVYADHIDWYRGAPSKTNGHIPDIVYFDSDRVLGIIEIETLDSCTHAHSISQLRAFTKTGVRTTVIIPKPSGLSNVNFKRTELNLKLRRFRLNVNVLEHPA